MRTTCLIFLAALLCLQSCTVPRYFYSASDNNNPMARRQGDIQMAAHISTNDFTIKGPTANAMANVALTRFAGIGAQVYTAKDGNRGVEASLFGPRDPVNIVNRYKRNSAAVQAFFFRQLDKKLPLFGELAIGAGKSKYAIDAIRSDALTEELLYYYSKARFWYLQPGVYYFFDEEAQTRVSLGFSGRLAFFRFSGFNTNYTSAELGGLAPDTLRGRTVVFVEPAANLRIRLKDIPLEISLQAGFSAHTAPEYFTQRNLHFSAGLGFSLNALRKNK